MATDGGFTPDGIFHPLPVLSLAPLERLFRHSVSEMLLRKGLLSPERIKLMKSWRSRLPRELQAELRLIEP